uniref:Uncharacterized protein n=1 Tax=Parascaris univalens TaxID=6257 RepID=A0A914ZM51_PARUN
MTDSCFDIITCQTVRILLWTTNPGVNGVEAAEKNPVSARARDTDDPEQFYERDGNIGSENAAKACKRMRDERPGSQEAQRQRTAVTVIKLALTIPCRFSVQLMGLKKRRIDNNVGFLEIPFGVLSRCAFDHRRSNWSWVGDKDDENAMSSDDAASDLMTMK